MACTLEPRRRRAGGMCTLLGVAILLGTASNLFAQSEISAQGDASHALYGTNYPRAAETFRNAGSNPASHLAFSRPTLGETYRCVVNLGGTTNHLFAWLAGNRSATTEVMPGGQVMLAQRAHPAGKMLGLRVVLGPVVVYDLPVPAEPILAGFRLYTQALHVDWIQPWKLSNAMDLVIGY